MNNIDSNIKNNITLLLKNLMWKHIIVKINKFILINEKYNQDMIMNFMISLDINTTNLIYLDVSQAMP